MDSRKNIDSKAAALMTLLCVVWGLQQVAIKGSAAEISPMLQISFRSGVAALMVGILMFVRKEVVSLKNGLWRPGLIVGSLFALEYLMVSKGLETTSASHMVVFLYTAPIFASLGLHWKLPSERLQTPQWIGIATAFAGIVITFYGRGEQEAQDFALMLKGDLFGLLAGIFWGATTVVIRTTNLSKASSRETLLYQLIGGFVLLLVASFAMEQTIFKPTQAGWLSLAFQAIVISFLSFLVWFWLLTKYLASRLGVLSFMTPIFGVFFGVALLNEPLEMNFILGSIMVFCGVILVTGHGWLKQVLRLT